MYLVINEGELSLPFIERYRLFDTPEAAMKHAESVGFCPFFGFGIFGTNLTPGKMSTYQSGNVNVSVVNVPTESEYKALKSNNVS